MLTRISVVPPDSEAWAPVDAAAYPSDAKTGGPRLSGFVAARIVGVDASGGSLKFVLQPAQRAVAALVTASSRGKTTTKNRYLARVRLIDATVRSDVE